MVAFKALLFFVTAIFAIAKSAHSTSVVNEQSQAVAVPNGFTSNGPASPDAALNLRFLLKANNLTGLEAVLYDVSTPGSKNYGKYLTNAEAQSYLAPSAATKFAVNEWLSANSIQAAPTSPTGDWLNFTIPVLKANELFGANFQSFTDQTTGEEMVRTLSYSIPANLTSHVRLLYPATVFPIPSLTQPVVAFANFKNATSIITASNNVTSDAVPTSCANIATPDCILGLYGIPRTVGPQNASRIAVPGFGQYAQEADLADFLNAYRPDLVPRPSFDFVSVDGGQNIQDPDLAGEEANLDIQYTVGIAGGVPVGYYSVPQANIIGYINFINYYLAAVQRPNHNLPQVVSVSYSFDEPTLQAYLGTEILEQICEVHMFLGTQGISFLYNTGDYGVAGSLDQNNLDCIQSSFVPTFPASCPYVTAVGATRGVNPETAAELSTGGFSNIFLIPDYQRQAVSTYLSEIGSLYAGRFNRSGRAFPDISAIGEGIPIRNSSRFSLIAGTSASTPIVASIIGQVNALRLQRGQGVLGFLNPKIYGTPGLATDITIGSNPGCGTDGFTAAPGWDPVTGVGSPIFSAFNALP